MKGRVCLVHWDPATAERRAEALRAEGWEVSTESEFGGRAYKLIRTVEPRAVVIDLSIRPSHGRELARSLRTTKATRGLPILFVAADPRERAKAMVEVEGAVFPGHDELAATLERHAGPAAGGTPP